MTFKKWIRALRVPFISVLLVLTSLRAHAEPVKVDIAYVPFVNIAQLFVMDAEGWAKEAGIELKLTRFTSGPALVQALASGKFDATYMAVSPVVVAKTAGIDLRIVASTGIEPVSFIGTGSLAKAFAMSASPAEAFALFRKTNGRPARIAALPKGTIPDTALRYYLATNKVPENTVQIIGQGAEQVLQSTLAKVVDGAAMPEPVLTIVLRKDPTARVLANGKQLMPGHPGFVLSVREPFAKAHPETVRKLVELNSRATLLIRSDPRRAARDVLRYMGQGLIDEDLMAAALSSPYNPISDDLVPIVASTDKMQTWNVQIGAQTRTLAAPDLFDLSFFNSLKR
jgi:NitT/TauT family transport system substrate-binding protein